MWVGQLFSPKRVASFRPIIEAEVERMMRSISSSRYCGRNCSVNLSEEVFLLSNKVIRRATLGRVITVGQQEGNSAKILTECKSRCSMDSSLLITFRCWDGWMCARG